METMLIPPKPAAAAPDTSAMETMLIPPKPADAGPDTSALGTMPIPAQRPLDPADEPSHASQDHPGQSQGQNPPWSQQ